MHRTEGANNLANLFTDGPPGTVFEENWLNAVQEEIAYVIEQAGLALKTASTDTRDQLYQAISTFIGISCNDPDYPMLEDGASSYVSLQNIGSSWETVGPTGSGADNEIAILNDVPDNAKTIRIRLQAVGGTVSTPGSTILNYRPYGSTVGPSIANEILDMVSNNSTDSYLAEHTVQLGTGKMFEIEFSVRGHTSAFSGYLFVVGYGF
jgi:hypothetical protein